MERENPMSGLVQINHKAKGRRVASVNGDQLLLIDNHTSVYSLAWKALESGTSLSAIVADNLSDKSLDYEPIYRGISSWRLLPSFDHPTTKSRCFVSGTGLTHRKSAQGRQDMHEKHAQSEPTDSMRMYNWGLQGGRPAPEKIGAEPEWFYKGSGEILRAHGDPLVVPAYALDGGEEAEIAGAYLIDGQGRPWRIGLTTANEFSDHLLERRNYLYLASSKLRTCSIGPELITDPRFKEVPGTVRIKHEGEQMWEGSVTSGTSRMCHSLENLEHHHFKHPAHRVPGDVHVHFFGADAFSFGDGVTLRNGDVIEIGWQGFGRPLRNPVRVELGPQQRITVSVLT